MTVPVAPDPPVGTDPDVDHLIASFANDAIQRGAPVEKVQGRVAQMMAHLNEHPELRAGARKALAQGADPGAVAARIGELSQGKPAPEGPEEAPDEGDATSKTARGIAVSAIRHIPGAEMAATGLRALTRGQSYPDAYSDIEKEAQSAGTPGQVADAAGAGLAALATGRMVPTPFLPAAGAAYGAAEGALQADPKANLSRRGSDAALDALVGYSAGTALKPVVGAANAARYLRRVLPGMKEADAAAQATADAAKSAKALKEVGKFEVIPEEPPPSNPIQAWSGPNIWDSFGDQPYQAPVPPEQDLEALLRQSLRKP